LQDHSFGAWVRAAGLARDAFATADTSWPADAAEVAEPEYDRKAGRQETGLRAAAWAMTLGRDLLHTHLDPQPGGRPSDWTPVVTSPPVACALLHQVGRWARQIAPYAGHVAITGRGLTSTERRSLYVACRALWMASWAVGTAQERRPPSVRTNCDCWPLSRWQACPQLACQAKPTRSRCCATD
jgi:hypothetical protein